MKASMIERCECVQSIRGAATCPRCQIAAVSEAGKQPVKLYLPSPLDSHG